MSNKRKRNTASSYSNENSLEATDKITSTPHVLSNKQKPNKKSKSNEKPASSERPTTTTTTTPTTSTSSSNGKPTSGERPTPNTSKGKPTASSAPTSGKYTSSAYGEKPTLNKQPTQDPTGSGTSKRWTKTSKDSTTDKKTTKEPVSNRTKLKKKNGGGTVVVVPLQLPLFPSGEVPDLKAKYTTTGNDLQKSLEDKLKSSQFRYINEQLYTMTGKEAKELFEKNPELPVVMDQKLQVADFGCGEATLAASLPHMTVHSFDLYKANERVIQCEMSHVPLPSHSIGVVVFCLSLMGTNFKEYIAEANRVLVVGGVLLIAEVKSRIESIHHFVQFLQEAGFVYDKSNKRGKMFVWFEFHKGNRGYYSSKERAVALLKPCKYKKR